MHQILVCASSQELPASLYDEKVESLSLLLMNSLSKLETSKESTSLYNSSKASIILEMFLSFNTKTAHNLLNSFHCVNYFS